MQSGGPLSWEEVARPVLKGDCRFGLHGLRCQLKSGSLLLKARTWTPVQKPRDLQFPLSPPMTERQWELYRLSVVEQWQESSHKAAVIGAIKHKLMILSLQEKASIEVPDTPPPREKQRKATP
jgi:hypothetical protein